MPVWGRILVQLRNLVDADLNHWRRDILNHFDPDDFGLDGPLQLVRFEDMDLVPSGNGVWLEMNLCLNYYDIGSEYADPSPFVAYADWLESHLPGCRIYYGHDNSDHLIEPFDMPRREALMDHYARFGNEPYQQRRRVWPESAKARLDRGGSLDTSTVVDASKIIISTDAVETADSYGTIQIVVSAPMTSIDWPHLGASERTEIDANQASGPIASSSSVSAS